MTDEIPVLDLTDYLAGKPGALEACATELRHACEQVGFYFIQGHRVSQEIVDAAFEASRRFHALPLAEKAKLKANEHNTGYMASGTSISRASKVYEGERKMNLVAAYSLKRDLPADHPDVVANKRFRGANPWPEDLPGFREACVPAMDALEDLALSLLPLYAVALDLPPDFFTEAFKEPQYSFRLAHYPPVEAEDNQFGIAAHTDSSFMTLLAQNEVEGLEIRPPHGRWVDAPVLPGAFLVNTGDLLHRWSNHRFRPTPHRAKASAPGVDRYAIPFFFDATNDFVMECLPTCHGPDNPPRYEPTTYSDYMLWFARQNYDHFKEAAAE
ncbi:MAG: 2-oxoglutarate and iron-dependent oxygenase domain-containing protein [Alphaproteobacteria bacterium]|nr:2-oxoglutarate and iron-dependent oxygenase domain-containing protein [Alphaproteobacteria bacterium]